MATPETAVYPDTQANFELQLSTLIPKLESERTGGQELTEAFIAEHFYTDSKDIDPASPANFPGLPYTAEFLKQGNELKVTKKDGFQPVFNGTSEDSWQSKSDGVLYPKKPEGASDYNFFALDGVKIPYIPLKLLVIFWYNGFTKAAVFISKGQGDVKYTKGKGKFN